MFSVLNVYKRKDYTSHDVVAIARKVFNFKKIGHMGTLDPQAEGVLPLAFGQATRLLEYFPDDKRYRADITLGILTTTLDVEGEIVNTTKCPPNMSEQEIRGVLAGFVGIQEQQVPLYSAVKVKGKKLYEVARKLEKKTDSDAGTIASADIELPTKTISIHELSLSNIDRTNPDHLVLSIDVHCSSGTYIRSLARDIGERLGVGGGHLSSLVRTAHGSFKVGNAIDIEMLKVMDNADEKLENPLDYLTIPFIKLAFETEFQQMINGMKLTPDEETLNESGVRLKTNKLYMVTYKDKPVCIAKADGDRLVPQKVFATVSQGA